MSTNQDIERHTVAVKYLFGKCKECGQGYIIYVPHDCHYCGGDVVETGANLQIQEREGFIRYKRGC